MMKDAIINNLPLILICGCTFLVGIGIGGAVTDMIYRMEEDDAEEMDSTGN